MEKPSSFRRVLGWVAVAISLAVTCFWTYWGINEFFHEGWHSPSFWKNLALFFVQYLSFSCLFVMLSLAAMRWPKIGLGLFAALAVFAAWFFSGGAFQVIFLLIVFPLLGMGFLYFWGRPEPKKWARRLLIGLPLLIVLGFGPPQLIRNLSRHNDGDFGARAVKTTDGQPLIWAPRGPGWPAGGASWEEAQRTCACLSADGFLRLDSAILIWRLPSVAEAVSSQMRHSVPSGGRWDPEKRKAFYDNTPDKETPLWDPYSQVIYYWLGEKTDEKHAFIIVYHGGVFSKPIGGGPAYLSFRCVKNPSVPPPP